MTLNGDGHYTRPDIARGELHPLYEKYGAWQQLEAMKSESGFLQQTLNDLYDSGVYILSHFETKIEEYEKFAETPEAKELRPEIVATKKAALLKESRETAYTYFKRAISKAQLGVDAATNRVYGLTAPIVDSVSRSQAQVIERSQRDSAIWQYLLSIDPKERPDAIRGNQERLRAVVNSPVPIISADLLDRLRRDYAFDSRPDLIAMLDDATHVRDNVRRRAANINATIIKMLLAKKIDDPNIEPDPRVHFDTFGARSPWEKHQIEQRILNYDRRQEEMRKRLERLAKDEPTFQTEKAGRKLEDATRKTSREDKSGERRRRV